MLSALRDQLVGGAKGVEALRADISAAIAATHAYTSEARGAATESQGAANTQAALRQASVAARTATAGFAGDYYEKRIFDPYLQFASAEDEEEYRRREEQRHLAIEKALAENTPEGNLRANRLAIDQLKDAGAHGAEASPAYQRNLSSLTGSEAKLSALVERQPAQTPSPTAKPVDILSAMDEVKPDQASAESAIAGLRNAGVVVSEGNGHGVSHRSAARGPDNLRIPT